MAKACVCLMCLCRQWRTGGLRCIRRINYWIGAALVAAVTKIKDFNILGLRLAWRRVKRFSVYRKKFMLKDRFIWDNCLQYISKCYRLNVTCFFRWTQPETNFRFYPTGWVVLLSSCSSSCIVLWPALKQAFSDRESPTCLQRHLSNIFR